VATRGEGRSAAIVFQALERDEPVFKKRGQVDAIPFDLIWRIFNQHQRGKFVRAQHFALQTVTKG
jgi:hypothetical protein